MEFITEQILRQTYIVVGIIALIGNFLNSKSLMKAIISSFKAMIGVVILLESVNILVASISPLTDVFNQAFSIPESHTVANYSDFLVEYGQLVSLIMLVGFILNILIAKWTPFKSIYLSANLMFWYPMITLAVGVEHNLSKTELFIVALVIYLLYITFVPILIKPIVKTVTNSDQFTIGHTASFYLITSYWISKILRIQSEDIENINSSKKWNFLREHVVINAMILTLLYIIGALVSNQAITSTYIMNSIRYGILFSAGLTILTLGVEMMLKEITYAFEGISKKFVPNAIPALDIPVLFPYGKTALIIGFAISLCVSVTTVFIFGKFGLLVYAVLPVSIGCYFDVAPGAIVANKIGGRYAVIITSIINGILKVVLEGFSLIFIADTIGSFIQAFGGNDFSIIVIVTEFFARFFH